MQDFKNLIDKSKRILRTSHLGPDADAVSSCLLLKQVFDFNFADKKTDVVLEEPAGSFDFVNGYKDIHFTPVGKTLDELNPHLLIILDANNIARCSRDPEACRLIINQKNIKVVVIDHHPDVEREPHSLYINQGSPAAAQDVYEICFDLLKLKKPANYAQTAMLGMFADTGGFVYKNPKHEATLKIVNQLIHDGADLEAISSRLNSYTKDQLLVMAELAKNVSEVGDCTYSYVSDEFTKQWKQDSRSDEDFKAGCKIFVNDFVRNIDGRLWGFIIYQDLLAPETTYSVSFRASDEVKDVSKLAIALGGGGHKPAAGARVKASNVESALKTVLDTIG